MVFFPDFLTYFTDLTTHDDRPLLQTQIMMMTRSILFNKVCLSCWFTFRIFASFFMYSGACCL